MNTVGEVTLTGRLKKGRGELETTRNELQFLKKNFPEWYKVIMIEEGLLLLKEEVMRRTKF